MIDLEIHDHSKATQFDDVGVTGRSVLPSDIRSVLIDPSCRLIVVGVKSQIPVRNFSLTLV